MNITPTHTALAPSSPLPHLSKPDVAAQLKQQEISQGPAATQAESPLKAIKASQEAQASKGSKPEDKTETETDDTESLKTAVDQIEKFIASTNKELKFVLDDEQAKGKLVVKIIDRETDKVIRQIPSEEALRIAKTLDQLKGLLLYNKA